MINDEFAQIHHTFLIHNFLFLVSRLGWLCKFQSNPILTIPKLFQTKIFKLNMSQHFKNNNKLTAFFFLNLHQINLCSHFYIL
jgi:hypothetical protein